MAHGERNSTSNIIEALLFYLRYRYLSATECLLFLCLYGMADESGRGHVCSLNLAKRLGRSQSRCRAYLNRLERHGLIETTRDHNGSGNFYRLERALTDAAKEPQPASDH